MPFPRLCAVNIIQDKRSLRAYPAPPREAGKRRPEAARKRCRYRHKGNESPRRPAPGLQMEESRRSAGPPQPFPPHNRLRKPSAAGRFRWMAVHEAVARTLGLSVAAAVGRGCRKKYARPLRGEWVGG